MKNTFGEKSVFKLGMKFILLNKSNFDIQLMYISLWANMLRMLIKYIKIEALPQAGGGGGGVECLG
jgi:hypothetical protein